MTNNIVQLLILPLVFLCLTLIILMWKRPSKNWLQTLSNSIIILLPFEVLPSILIGGARLKVNYIIILIASMIYINLLLRKKILFKAYKLSLFPILITFLSLFSVFNVINIVEFGVSFLGLTFCALATFFVANYSTDLRLQIKRLFIVLFFVSIFGLYQFAGDMIGLSQSFTFLRDNYTKEIFGIPRIHATANEPQLFANMLFLPILFFFTKLIKRGGLKEKKSKISIILYQIVIGFAFILSISKGATAALFLVAGLIAFYLFTKKQIIKFRPLTLFFIFLSPIAIYLSSSTLQNAVSPIILNIINTLTGTSASSAERSQFIDSALLLLNSNNIFGIGLGQFGTYVGAKDLIVNNVYYEIWLESGIYTLITFLIFNLLIIKRLLKNSLNIWNIVFLGTLLTYLIQWSFFSPVYITPFFIVYGLIIKHLYESKNLDNQSINTNI